MGFCLRIMEYIADNGWNEFIKDYTEESTNIIT